MIAIFFSFFIFAQSPEAVFENNRGVRDFSQGAVLPAQNLFLKAMEGAPSKAEVHVNLGLTFLALEQFEKAEKSFRTALQYGGSSEALFSAHFHLGFLYQKQQKKDEALEQYERALEYSPESIETKTNIELLLQDQNQGSGGGEGDQNSKDQEQKGDGSSQDQQGKDPKNDQGKEQQKQDSSGQYRKNQPQKFKSQELTPGDVNKILGEIRQQEGKIRSEFNKRETKESPRGKDW
ncbi:MAG: tetratricopeptide repeat protein [Proteobacteria bacterium]|jgi:Tfp pilus assembly protein PilF|nr:tetratricopeptide repeat protein [Pseudomonadota bacterium]